jgi:hypothetical protein
MSSLSALTTEGLDAAEKKFGGSMGQDAQKNRAVNEKIVSHAKDIPCTKIKY